MHVGGQLASSLEHTEMTEAGCVGSHVAAPVGRAWWQLAEVAAALALGCKRWGQRPRGKVAGPAVVWECTCWSTWAIAEHEERLGTQGDLVACACRHKQHWQQIEPAAAGAVVAEQLEHVALTKLLPVAVVERQEQASAM